MKSGKGQWLLSDRASSLFLISSIVVLTTGFLVVVLSELSRFSAVREEFSANPNFYVPVIVILAANTLCAFFLLVGMPWYWMRFDDSRRFVKLLWLGSFVALGWYSMAIYYLVVYRRRRRQNLPKQASNGHKSITIARFLKYGLLIGSAGCLIATVVLGFWPAALNRTRIPLFVAQLGAWCIVASICYLAFEFVSAGMRRSK